MSTDQVVTLIGFVGISTVVSSIVTYYIQLKKSKQDSRHELKEKRYKAIILMCYAFVNYESEKVTLIINRPDLASIEQLQNELQVEWINMALYASDSVIMEMKKFLHSKDQNSFNHLILTMRKDLYGIRTKLNENIFNK